jgi:acetoin:2,6-dichlorophenolindophenol oxidoreductase subunit alpha
MSAHRKQCRLLETLSFQELRGIEGREMHRLFHISVKKSGRLSTASRIARVTLTCCRERCLLSGRGVIYNQPFIRPSLPPDFLSRLVGSADCMRLALIRKPHARPLVVARNRKSWFRSASSFHRENTVTMGGRVRQTDATAAVSTGGSLISSAKLKQLYATMVRCRLLTERARALRDQAPSAGLYAASMGQEAIATGCAVDLRSEDTISLAPHDSIASLVKGVPLDDIVAQIYASRTHADIERAKRAEHPAHNVIPASSSPGAQLSVATDVALVNKQKKNSNVTVAFSCKAATTLGRWHEALEFAASGSLPIIFVVENNPWANPAGLKACNEEEDFTLKARTFGFPVITVDGNDVVAVYRVAYESLERVRQDGGPVLIEGKTYRLHGQTKPRQANTKAWRTDRDPLTHMERYLTAKGLYTTRWKNQVMYEFSRKLDTAIRGAQMGTQKAAENAQRSRWT